MHHRLLRLLLIPVAVLLVAALLVVAAELIVRWEPVTASLPSPTPGEYVQLQADERLFTLFAALNATGYDDENNEQGMSEVRQHVRSTLAARSLPSLRRLQPYMAVCRSIHQSWCVTWVLQRGPAPRFARAVEVRLRDPAQHERLIRQEEAGGFLLVRPLAARLEDYEASGQPMAEYMPVLLDALNDETLLR